MNDMEELLRELAFIGIHILAVAAILGTAWWFLT